jgi:hypothetical protein
MTGGKPLVVNDWSLFAHPIFLDQLDSLTAQVEALKRKEPAGLTGHSSPRCRVIAEQRLPLADRKVPVPFELQVQRAALEGGANYLVRGAIVLEGRTRWLSGPVEVRAHPGPINVGTLMMKPCVPVAFSSPPVCGDRRASVGVGRSGQREFLQLTVEGERFELYESITASGSRYDAVDDARTYVWFKGQRATLMVRGVTYPECTGANHHAISNVDGAARRLKTVFCKTSATSWRRCPASNMLRSGVRLRRVRDAQRCL